MIFPGAPFGSCTPPSAPEGRTYRWNRPTHQGACHAPAETGGSRYKGGKLIFRHGPLRAGDDAKMGVPLQPEMH